MALRSDVGTDEAQAIADIYRDSELAMLQRIAGLIAEGIDLDNWEAFQLGRLQTVREEVLAELARTNPAAVEAIREALATAYNRGELAAFADVRGVITDPKQVTSAAQRAATAALARDITTGLADAQGGILRAVDDVFREVVARASSTVVTGAAGRIEAAQFAINELLGHGIQGIELSRGTMSLPDYVSMAVRTATSRSARAGHQATMIANDIGLIVIHPGPRPCDICDQWARGILSIDGTPAGTTTLTDIITGKPIEVEVMGTLEDAIADGYQHPNCRCGEAAFLPGATDPDIIEREPWDAEGYAAQQEQRDLERAIRDAKTEEALALTDAAREEAAAAVREAQANIRDLLAQNEYLKRQSDREQIGRPL